MAHVQNSVTGEDFCKLFEDSQVIFIFKKKIDLVFLTIFSFDAISVYFSSVKRVPWLWWNFLIFFVQFPSCFFIVDRKSFSNRPVFPIISALNRIQNGFLGSLINFITSSENIEAIHKINQILKTWWLWKLSKRVSISEWWDIQWFICERFPLE